MESAEIHKLEQFFITKFGNTELQVRARPKKTDSAELYLSDEFLGVIYLDDEDGDKSYNFSMAILDVDLG